MVVSKLHYREMEITYLRSSIIYLAYGQPGARIVWEMGENRADSCQ